MCLRLNTLNHYKAPQGTYKHFEACYGTPLSTSRHSEAFRRTSKRLKIIKAIHQGTLKHFKAC